MEGNKSYTRIKNERNHTVKRTVKSYGKTTGING
jgi:hypothetical protein